MAEEYRIHLNFLSVVGEMPAFRVYRKERVDLNIARPENLDVHGYSLPVDKANLENRVNYWISFKELPGYEEVEVEPAFNNDLVRAAMLTGLRNSARAQLDPSKLREPDHSFVPELHFLLCTHPEGVEELVVSPYYLKSARKFGFVADFHFRLAPDIAFSRRVQQLSLSLDANYRRNLNYCVDRAEKIASFVRTVRNVFDYVMLPGAQSRLRIAEDFRDTPADRLRGRVYVFGSEKESRSQFNGLRDFGPLRPVAVAPKLLFVFRERDRQAARTLAGALRGSKQKERFGFPGFQALFRTDIEIDANPIILKDFSEASMLSALERVRAEEGKVIPMLIVPDNEEVGYLNHKAVFAHGGIATQVCTLGVIQDDRMLKWATANIALQVFCKAGGLPWKVRPTSDRSLIIGISQSHKILIKSDRKVIDRHFAFSILTDSSGLFQKIQVLGDANEEADYLSQLRANLREMLLSNASQFTRVVVHTSFKLRRREIEAIYNVTQEAASDPSTARTRFAVVKVNQRSHFFGVNRGVNSLVPFEGTRVKLGPGEYLVWFEGIFPDKLTVTKAFSGATHLQFLRISEDREVSEELLLQELVDLSGANWRGFNAKSAPVSTFYCHLVADLVHDFQEHNLPLPAVEGLYPWFI
jgi:hypothetical protein